MMWMRLAVMLTVLSFSTSKPVETLEEGDITETGKDVVLPETIAEGRGLGVERQTAIRSKKDKKKKGNRARTKKNENKNETKEDKKKKGNRARTKKNENK